MFPYLPDLTRVSFANFDYLFSPALLGLRVLTPTIRILIGNDGLTGITQVKCLLVLDSIVGYLRFLVVCVMVF